MTPFPPVVAPPSSLWPLPGALCPHLPCTNLAAAVLAKPLCWGASAPWAAPPAGMGVHVGLGGGGGGHWGARGGGARGGTGIDAGGGGAYEGSAVGHVYGRAC